MSAVTLVGSPALTRAAFAATADAFDTLVLLDLRGGMDGLSVIAPVGDPYYHQLRPSIGIPTSTGIPTGNRLFALHPALAPLKPFYDAGTFGAVHAVAQPDESRSHFQSQYEIDRCAPDTSLTTGWLDRAILAMGAGTGMQAATLGLGVPDRSFAGPAPVFAATSLSNFTLTAASAGARFTAAINAQQASSALPWARSTQAALTAVNQVATITNAQSTLARSAVYPKTSLAAALADVARLIRANVGLRVATVDMGNWDMHQGLGNSGTGWMANNLTDVSSALAAFATDLGPIALARTSLITVSEFGRRAGQNGSGGVDHGHGNAVLFLGGGLNGGQILGNWPSLAPDALDQGDLAGTTDYRDVFAEVLAKRCGVSTNNMRSVFPGYRTTSIGIAKPS